MPGLCTPQHPFLAAWETQGETDSWKRFLLLLGLFLSLGFLLASGNLCVGVVKSFSPLEVP